MQEIKCQYCPTIVKRQSLKKAATCFDCKVERQKKYTRERYKRRFKKEDMSIFWEEASKRALKKENQPLTATG